MESIPCPTALQRIFSQISKRNLYPNDFSYQPAKCSFIRSAYLTDMTAYGGCVPLSSICYVPLICLCKGKLSNCCYRTKKSVSLANNKLLQISQVQLFGEVTENLSRKNKKKLRERFGDESTQGFQLPRG